MPSVFHEAMVDGMNDLITTGINSAQRSLWSRLWSWRRRLHKQTEARELARVYKGGSADIGRSKRRSPDSTFYRKPLSLSTSCKTRTLSAAIPNFITDPTQPNTPCTVLEVGFSQSQKALWQRAQRYLCEQRIRCVVLVKLPYRNKRNRSIGCTGSISIWRARKVESYRIDIRDGARTAVGDSLKLYPSDFLPIAPCADAAAVVEIPLANVVSCLRCAREKMIAFEHQTQWPADLVSRSLLKQ